MCVCTKLTEPVEFSLLGHNITDALIKKGVISDFSPLHREFGRLKNNVSQRAF